MLPGQEVNKDVYAVNTGNIGAFVKESVSAKLTYTYEKKEATFDKNKVSEYVELDENIVKAINGRLVDGATSQEAGAFLVYSRGTDGKEILAPGQVNSATIRDEAQSDGETPIDNPGKVEGTRWHPTAEGVYIFRRALDSDNKWNYAGYYYVPGEGDKEGNYYKIVIGNDSFRAANENESVVLEDGTRKIVFDISVNQDKLGPTASVNAANGTITGTVPVQYVKNVTVTAQPATLTYLNRSDKGVAALKATYTANAGNADAETRAAVLKAAEEDMTAKYEALLDAFSKGAMAERDYENTLGDYLTAKSRYDQTYADWEYATALENATNILYAAANNRGQAEVAKDNAYYDLQEALDKLQTEAVTLDTAPGSKNINYGDLFASDTGLNDDGCDISFKSIFGYTALDGHGTVSTGTLNDIIENGNWGNADNSQLLKTIKEYRKEMHTVWGKIKTATDELDSALDAFANLNATDNGQADKAQEMLDTLNEKRAALETLLRQYKTLYADLKEYVTSNTPGADDEFLTQLTYGTTVENDIDAWIARLDSASDLAGLEQSIVRAGDDNDITDYVADFKKKYAEYLDQIHNVIPAAEGAWTQAVNTYNNTVRNAQTTYMKKIKTNQLLVDEDGTVHKNAFDGLKNPSDTVDGASDDKAKWLTNNNNDLVQLYAAEKDDKDHSQKESDNQTPEVNDTDGTLWQTIGKDVDATGSLQARYTSGSYNAENDTNTQSTYTAAVNNTEAVKGENDFLQLTGSPDTAMKQTLGALATAKSTKENDVTTAAYKQAEDNLADAKAAYEAAKTAYNAANSAAAAGNGDESKISFTIYLDDENSALDWTSELKDGESAQVANFYYNYILAAGQTSHKLIDAVKLDETVGAKDYKNLTLDLNVGLESAQMTYSDDQRKVTSTAVDSNDDFTMKVDTITPDVAVPENNDKDHYAVTWKKDDAPAAKVIYFAGLTRVEPKDVTGVSVTEGETTTTYPYEIDISGTKYYGTSKTGEYVELTKNGDTYTKADNAATVTVEAIYPDSTTAAPTSEYNTDKSTKTYKLGENDIGATDIKDDDTGKSAVVDGEAVNFTKKITVSGQDYYGADANPGTKFYKLTESEGAYIVDGEGLVLSETTTTYKLGSYVIAQTDIKALNESDRVTQNEGGSSVTYTHKVTVGGKTYYGTGNTTNSKFGVYDADATTKVSTESQLTLTITNTTTP
jgi:hypothetical protein